MLEEKTDKELVALAQQQDMDAFNTLVARYQYKVSKLITRYVIDPGDAMDLTQDTFMRVHAALPKFRGDSAFYTWVYRVAINTAKNYLTLKTRRPPLTDLDVDTTEYSSGKSLLQDEESPEGCVLCDETETVLFNVVDHLPQELRLALILREIEGLSYEDIADVLDCPVGTVRSRIFRAREAVEKKMAEHGNC